MPLAGRTPVALALRALAPRAGTLVVSGLAAAASGCTRSAPRETPLAAAAPRPQRTDVAAGPGARAGGGGDGGGGDGAAGAGREDGEAPGLTSPEPGTAAAGPAFEPDGNDDPEDPGEGAVPASGRFVRVGRPPLALQRICDLRPLGGSLYAAHANQPLGTDGATITRYTPQPAGDGDAGIAGDAGKRPRPPFSVAFDWNRPGEPTAGGGAGQGFLRVHAIGGRLFVPDADPPYNGFGITEGGTEGFVFVSGTDGLFARATGEHFRPPARPAADGGAGASVLPRAYHVLDVVRFRGHLYASTGSVPPGERAWHGPSPGALHEANDSLSRFVYRVGYPVPYQDGVWRLGFLARFRGRLYAGIQDYDGREPNDFVVVDPPAGAEEITQDDLRGVRVTGRGGALTLRWYADRGRLFWIALEKGWGGALRVTADGDTWEEVALPPEVGRPTDIVRFRDALVVLAERGLVRLVESADRRAGGRAPARIDGAEVIAVVPDKKSPFEITDSFCAAPLGVLAGELYAGGQRDGSLYRLTAEP